MKEEGTQLWNRKFWLVCLAEFFLSTSLYMLLPAFPLWMAGTYNASPMESAAILAVFGISVFILGPFFNYLVDRFKRKTVCQIALLAVAASTAGFYFVGGLGMIFGMRILQGAMFGVAASTLGSTLAIDLSNSNRRTDANNAFFWFNRFALAIGPLTGILVYQLVGIYTVLMTSIAIGVTALILVTFIRIPFRAPLSPNICSFDRFFLFKGTLPFVNLMLVAAIFGIALTCNMSYEFYGFIMLGFTLSLFGNRMVFRNAEEKAEIMSGFIFLFFAMLLQLTHPFNHVAMNLSATLIGLGIGLCASHFLDYFLELAEHCQRGTANTTYMLSWESGMALGYFIGYSLVGYATDFWQTRSGVAMIICIVAAVLYWFVTHRYVDNKKRK